VPSREDVMPTLNQGAWEYATDRYVYGHRSIPEIEITGAPDDADFTRWAMLHDDVDYLLYCFRGDTTDTLYSFGWNGFTYAHGHHDAREVTLADAPNATSFDGIAMLHAHGRKIAYLRVDDEPSTLLQFVRLPGTDVFRWNVANHIPRIAVVGFPADTDWARWDMLHDGVDFRFYAFQGDSDDRLYQGAFNVQSLQYEYGYRSIPNLRLVGYPDGSGSSSSMLHDGDDYRFYFQR
jgi:hypothetical protein